MHDFSTDLNKNRTIYFVNAIRLSNVHVVVEYLH